MPEPGQIQSLPGAVAGRVQRPPAVRDGRFATAVGARHGNELPAKVSQAHSAY